MKKEDREKYEEFIKAELANGGRLVHKHVYGRRGSTPRTLETVEGIIIELPSTIPGRHLIERGEIVRVACSDGYAIADIGNFDLSALGERKSMYRVPKPSLKDKVYDYALNDYVERDVIDTIFIETRIVTFFGTFGKRCGGDIYADLDLAKKGLMEQIDKLIDERDEAINAAEKQIEDISMKQIPDLKRRLMEVDNIVPKPPKGEF